MSFGGADFPDMGMDPSYQSDDEFIQRTLDDRGAIELTRAFLDRAEADYSSAHVAICDKQVSELSAEEVQKIPAAEVARLSFAEKCEVAPILKQEQLAAALGRSCMGDALELLKRVPEGRQAETFSLLSLPQRLYVYGEADKDLLVACIPQIPPAEFHRMFCHRLPEEYDALLAKCSLAQAKNWILNAGGFQRLAMKHIPLPHLVSLFRDGYEDDILDVWLEQELPERIQIALMPHVTILGRLIRYSETSPLPQLVAALTERQRQALDAWMDEKLEAIPQDELKEGLGELFEEFPFLTALYYRRYPELVPLWLKEGNALVLSSVLVMEQDLTLLKPWIDAAFQMKVSKEQRKFSVQTLEEILEDGEEIGDLPAALLLGALHNDRVRAATIERLGDFKERQELVIAHAMTKNDLPVFRKVLPQLEQQLRADLYSLLNKSAYKGLVKEAKAAARRTQKMSSQIQAELEQLQASVEELKGMVGDYDASSSSSEELAKLRGRITSMEQHTHALRETIHDYRAARVLARDFSLMKWKTKRPETLLKQPAKVLIALNGLKAELVRKESVAGRAIGQDHQREDYWDVNMLQELSTDQSRCLVDLFPVMKKVLATYKIDGELLGKHQIGWEDMIRMGLTTAEAIKSAKLTGQKKILAYVAKRMAQEEAFIQQVKTARITPADLKAANITLRGLYSWVHGEGVSREPPSTELVQLLNKLQGGGAASSSL